MIGLRVSVPIACWRKGWAREHLETEPIPPPATCYGFLLSLVGEERRRRHLGARVSCTLLNRPARSTVLRTLWRVKSSKTPQGQGTNMRPDYQQLLIGAELVVWVDRGEEPDDGLEARVRAALADPGSVTRYGGLSLGESSHLINDLSLWRTPSLPDDARTFVTDPRGHLSLPVWVDHVGSAGTRHVTGTLLQRAEAPNVDELPLIRTS